MNEDFEVRIPREINDFKEEFYLGMNFRQLSSVICASIISLSFYFFLPKFISKDIVENIIILCCTPVLATGFFLYNRLSFEQFVPILFRQYFIFNKPILYKQYSSIFKTSKDVRKENFNVYKKQKKEKKTKKTKK